MDPILLLVIAALVVLILVVVLSRKAGKRTDPPLNDADTETFEFPADETGLTPITRRRTLVRVAPRTIGGVPRKLLVTAAPLSLPDDLTPPQSKNIAELVVAVINPSVRIAGTDQEVYEFDPPLELTVDYTSADADKGKAAGASAAVAPELSLITVYNDGSDWRYERLATTVNHDAATNSGTLTAPLETLHPQDPVAIGRP